MGLRYSSSIKNIVEQTVSTTKTLYQNSKQIFSEMKLRGLVPNFLIHVSVSALYIRTIGQPILLQQNRQADRGRGRTVSFLGIYKSDLLSSVTKGREERGATLQPH